MTPVSPQAAEILAKAAREAGLDAVGATLIRDGSNVMYRLPGHLVARVGPARTRDLAERQVDVARWLASEGLNVVRPAAGVAQPIVVDQRPVTWWVELPEHRPATAGELGAVLKALHEVEPPRAFTLPGFDPFAGVKDRASTARQLSDSDRFWLCDRVEELRDEFVAADLGAARRVIHGDAWQGNVAVPDDGPPILLDFEHVSLGHRDWDLIPVAVDRVDFARLSAGEYHDFVTAYGGYDVVSTDHFRLFADIQELRWVAFTLSKANDDYRAAQEAQHRISCLRGENPRPWTWTAF